MTDQVFLLLFPSFSFEENTNEQLNVKKCQGLKSGFSQKVIVQCLPYSGTTLGEGSTRSLASRMQSHEINSMTLQYSGLTEAQGYGTF
jgi:hypothetical protein